MQGDSSKRSRPRPVVVLGKGWLRNSRRARSEGACRRQDPGRPRVRICSKATSTRPAPGSSVATSPLPPRGAVSLDDQVRRLVREELAALLAEEQKPPGSVVVDDVRAGSRACRPAQAWRGARPGPGREGRPVMAGPMARFDALLERARRGTLSDLGGSRARLRIARPPRPWRSPARRSSASWRRWGCSPSLSTIASASRGH